MPIIDPDRRLGIVLFLRRQPFGDKEASRQNQVAVELLKRLRVAKAVPGLVLCDWEIRSSSTDSQQEGLPLLLEHWTVKQEMGHGFIICFTDRASCCWAPEISTEMLSERMLAREQLAKGPGVLLVTRIQAELAPRGEELPHCPVVRNGRTEFLRRLLS